MRFTTILPVKANPESPKGFTSQVRRMAPALK
jgi:hypothetical protein